MKYYDHPYLPAPVIPVAEPDGLIKTKDLVDPIVIRVPIQDNAKALDRYSILIGKVMTSIQQVLTDPLPSDNLAILVPATLFPRDGTYDISYALTSYPGGMLVYSQSTPIKLDRIAPGATYLAPISFSKSDPGNLLSGSVHLYVGMAWGDTIHTFCNGAPGPTYQITDADFSGRPIQITFERKFLESLNSNLIRVTYHVMDRAGNRSVESQPVDLTGFGPEDVDWTPSGIEPDDSHWIPSGTPSDDTGWTPSGM